MTTNETKYVVFVDTYGNWIPAVFPATVEHFEMVPRGCRVLSAGFCNMFEYNGKMDVKCFGESTSLRVVANPDRDRGVIRRFILGLRN